ncbi:MAG: ABC transporter ATP-binding protein [Gemmatimonadetes bacterium]|nr:ABC transporter ATP-binding protein [Gemmatimonadota bacterium]
MSNAIETRGLVYRAGKSFEIRDLALNVPAGSMYGFLGPNGAGKTTTIRLLLGLLRPVSGAITVLDRRIPREAPRVLQRTGYVPESPHLYSTLTVAEAIAFHHAFYPGWDQGWADELLAMFGLVRDRRLARLSKGEMGKLMMLLALAQRPELLVLDEPTDGLDPVVRRDVLSALLEYVAQHNATVFISSHLVHELERICDWVGVMDRGRLVAELPMHSFKSGIKRIRLSDPPALPGDTPFVLLNREPAEGSVETWVVRGWQPPMAQYFEGVGASVREVVDLDLEEGFVELLRTFRVNPD